MNTALTIKVNESVSSFLPMFRRDVSLGYLSSFWNNEQKEYIQIALFWNNKILNTIIVGAQWDVVFSAVNGIWCVVHMVCPV